MYNLVCYRMKVNLFSIRVSFAPRPFYDNRNILMLNDTGLIFVISNNNKKKLLFIRAKTLI